LNFSRLEQLTIEERKVIQNVSEQTKFFNIDNISRTMAYFDFFIRNPEIKWSFLASMVSRNAGWSMGDLEGEWLPRVLSKKIRHRLFLTYERANWLIFLDAFPQLCLYEQSKNIDKPLFHLNKYFHVSPFMIEEWNRFWLEGNLNRLMYSLIINEQNLIQRPIIEHPIYKRRVFHSWLFLLQDRLHFSTVLFPTLSGELYGLSVHNFRNLDSRIKLGKQLSELLFHPDYYPLFKEFSRSIKHTGSRKDYEIFAYKFLVHHTPPLMEAFPIVEHHRGDFRQWIASQGQVNRWLMKESLPKKIHLNHWYLKKQKQLHAGILAEQYFLDILKQRS
jgi:hypothetical protein